MENKKLLEEVIKNRLETAKTEEIGSEKGEKAFNEAMKAIDRCIDLEKVEISKEEFKEKLELSKEEFKEKLELSKEEKKDNKIIKYVEIVAVPLVVLTIDHIFKRRFMKDVCHFEKDYTFTTQAGKSISNFFKFKK